MTQKTSGSARSAGARKWLAEVSKESKPRPAAIVFYGPPGVGKSTFAAATVKPVFMIDSQEDGINTLKASGIVDAAIPILPPVETWDDVLGQLDALATEDHPYRTLVVDTLGGLERLCHTFVCDRDFRGIWGDTGFASYAKGYEVALPEWRRLLIAFDLLRAKGMMIVCLSHSIIRPFKNPAGEDYDRFILDLHHKTWSVTSKWTDMVLFANFFVQVTKEGSRAKGKGGQDRVIYTEFEAAFDAKNRHNLPADISMGTSGKEAWTNLVTAIKKGKKS